jgi:hypothetical protein
VGKEFAQTPTTYPAAKGEEKPWNGNATYCRDWLATCEAAGVTPVKSSDWLTAEAMMRALAVWLDKVPVLATGKAQVSVVWVEPKSGVTCKGRIDWITPGWLCDYKTTVDASPWGFGRQAGQLGYHIQAAMYQDAWHILTGERVPFLFIAQEKVQPFAAGLYPMQDASIAAGRALYEKAAYWWGQSKKSGEWPGYSSVPEPINIPQYMIDAAMKEGTFHEQHVADEF